MTLRHNVGLCLFAEIVPIIFSEISPLILLCLGLRDHPQIFSIIMSILYLPPPPNPKAYYENVAHVCLYAYT